MSTFVTESPGRCRGTVVFDLDGTLVDSVPDLLAAGNRLMAGLGFAPFAAAEVSAMVGDGAAALVGRMVAARGGEAGPGHVDAFLRDYTAHAADHTRPYPGVADTLGVLGGAGWRLAVCTNKPAAAARELLERLGLLPCFAAVGAGDSYSTRKPDPAHLLATVRDAGGDPARAIMVGDHGNDIAAAAGAGMPSIFAAWGYGRNTGATRTAAAATDIPGIAAGLL